MRRAGALLVAGAIAAAILWLLRGSATAPPSPTPTVSGATPAAPVAEAPPSPPPPSPPPRDASSGARATREPAPTAARPPLPDEGPDAAAWRASRVAFGLRELGAMAPYVRAGLDAARRDMEFCFRQAPPRAEGADEAPPERAVLLLYLEAREGALDVVDTRVDYPGTLDPQVVECCREVLRGLEIPAFRAVPGRRWRFKYPLE